ncbi:MAG: MAPEG family protein [Usitatibacteraceae bacterium]
MPVSNVVIPLVPITALYAAMLAMLLVILMLAVVKLRRSLRVGLGDGGNRDLQQAIRAHGNATECVPIFLLLLAVFELNHGSVLLLHVFGVAFLTLRVLHAWGLYSSSGASIGRVGGTAGTIGILVTLAIANLFRLF